MTAVMFALVPKGVFDRSNVTNLLRSLLAGAAMGAGMLVAAPFGLIAMTMAGGVSFALAAVASRAISIDEMRGVMQTVMNRG